jgi:hypothetical protein
MTSCDPNHDRLSHDNEKFQRILTADTPSDWIALMAIAVLPRRRHGWHACAVHVAETPDAAQREKREACSEPHSLRPNTLRVRRHRQRRPEGLRLLTVEIPEPVIEAAIARGLLKPEDCTQSSSVMRSAFAAQLSDTALNWLTSNAVITREQRADAVAILQRVSEWLES